jgi:tripartite-type tricarboxylate transporter receptor subunit TctC
MTNKAGGAGVLGTKSVLDAPADGYTLLFNTEGGTTFQVMGLADLNYVDYFDPIIVTAINKCAIIVDKESKYQTFDELMADIKANPGQITWGDCGSGSVADTAKGIINKVEGFEVNTVIYAGDGPVITAVIGGQLDCGGVALSVAVPYILSGEIKCLGILDKVAPDLLPNVPLLAERDDAYDTFVDAYGSWAAVFAKKGTDPAILEKLKEVFLQAYNDPEYQKFLKDNGWTTLGLTGEEAEKFIRDKYEAMSWLLWVNGAAKESPEKYGIPKPANMDI